MRIGKLSLSVLLFLFLSFFLFLANNQKAFANQPQFEASWDIQVDFIGNQPNATLTVRVKEYFNDMVTNHSTKHELSCHVPASVAIENDEAVFNGKGGILCKIPSLKQIVFEMTDGQFVLPDECDCKSGAFAAANLTLDPNTAGDVESNPVFTMKDLWMDAQLLPDTSFRGQMAFTVDNHTALSDGFHVLPSSNFLYANFLQTNGAESEDLSFKPLFDANGTDLEATPEQIEEDLALSFKQHRIYIGYSPLTHQGFNGRIRTLHVDPGCFGSG
ncbi:MAG: hypothetical protein AAF490_10245 [Chloroflexota bacterium]